MQAVFIRIIDLSNLWVLTKTGQNRTKLTTNYPNWSAYSKIETEMGPNKYPNKFGYSRIE